MLLSLFLFASCSNTNNDTADERIDPSAYSVLETGPYFTGYTTTEYSFLDQLGETVDLLVHVWYPTSEETNDHPVYFNILEDENAHLEAPLAPRDKRNLFPVVVFSHGSFLHGASSAYLARHFSQHGWVVVAPNHPSHLLSDYVDGVNISVHYHRPVSNAASLDALNALSMFAGQINATDVLLTGFSFGGYDNWVSVGAELNREAFASACESGELTGDCSSQQLDFLAAGFNDVRFKAIVPMAGATPLDKYASDGRNAVSVPVFQLSGSEDDDDPDRVFTETNGPSILWLEIPNGCHAMFSVGGCPGIDTETGYSIIQSYVLAYGRSQIVQDTSDEINALLDGTLSPWEGTEIQEK